MDIVNIMRWLRRPSVVIGILIAAVAAGLAAGEFLVRSRERNRDDVPSSTPSAFYRHRQLGIALVRNLDYYGWFNVNSHGFRGPEVALHKPPGELRIMVVGGSTTFDTQVSADSMTWPARLGHWLRVLHPDVIEKLREAWTTSAVTVKRISHPCAAR